MINIIVAFDPEMTIGVDNSLPWKIKDDLRLFRQLTTNNFVVMGRNTYESIGKPLPNRINVVITSKKIQGNFYAFSNLEESLMFCKKINPNKEIFIIGGRQLYEYSLKSNLVERMFVSKIKNTYKGDIKFPNFQECDWKKNLKEKYEDFDLWIYTKN